MLVGVALAAALAGCGADKPDPPHTVPAARFHFIPQSASFVSPSLGWAWGPARWPPLAGQREAGVLAKTEDGGQSWSGVVIPGRDWAATGFGPGLSGVRFASANRGYLFGSQLLVTDDGGTSWRRVPVPGRILDLETAGGQAYALGLDCANFSGCYTVHLYRVGARALTEVGPRSDVSADASLVARGQRVYLLTSPLVGLGSSLWVSRDSGRSWKSVPAPCQWPGADALAAWSPSDLALACGSQPAAGSEAKAFYASVDGGRSWRPAGQLPFGPGYIASLAAADANTWALGEGRGQIETTTDGGRRWHMARFTGAVADVEGWGDVAFTDARHGFAVPGTLNGDVLAFTANGGRTWRDVGYGYAGPTAQLR